MVLKKEKITILIVVGKCKSKNNVNKQWINRVCKNKQTKPNKL